MPDAASPVHAPSREDPVVAALSEVAGGPAGRRLAPSRSWWTPVRVIVALTIAAACLGVVGKQHCRESAWTVADPDQYVHLCYSDIPLLFGPRHIADGEVPPLPDLLSMDWFVEGVVGSPTG